MVWDEHYGVEPDIITSAKGMGNGVPIGWTIATPEVVMHSGIDVSTSVEPVSCAVGLAVIKVIEEDDLRTNCRVAVIIFTKGFSNSKRNMRASATSAAWVSCRPSNS